MTKILDIAMADGRFYTLIDALRAAELTALLDESAPFTLLAPIDDAFAVLQPEGVRVLLSDAEFLRRILTHHILAGRQLAAQLVLNSPITPLDGQLMQSRVEGSELYIADARVVMRDIEGDDGVMHAIDKLILPT
jgi:transforming growth factor-beta-induced protein